MSSRLSWGVDVWRITDTSHPDADALLCSRLLNWECLLLICLSRFSARLFPWPPEDRGLGYTLSWVLRSMAILSANCSNSCPEWSSSTPELSLARSRLGQASELLENELAGALVWTFRIDRLSCGLTSLVTSKVNVTRLLAAKLSNASGFYVEPSLFS